MLSFVREHFAIIRVFGKPGITRALPGFLMPLNHNVNTEQVNTRRMRFVTTGSGNDASKG